MQKQFVNRLSVFFIFFLFAIYFINYYLQFNYKSKLYLTLSNYNLSFVLDINNILCKDSKIYELYYFKNNCNDELLQYKSNFKIIQKNDLNFFISNNIDHKILTLSQELEKIIHDNNFKLVKNNNSKIMFSTAPSFFSLSENDITSQEFYSTKKLTFFQKFNLKKKIELSLDKSISNFILMNKKILNYQDEYLKNKEKLFIRDLINFTFNNRNFLNKDIVFLNIIFFNSLSNSQDSLERFIKNYGLEFSSTDIELSKKYLDYLSNLKIDNFEKFEKMKLFFYFEVYKKLITNEKNFYKLYVFN